jgi:hypothetical protein
MMPVMRQWRSRFETGLRLRKGQPRIDSAIAEGARCGGLALRVASELTEAWNAVVSSLQTVREFGAVEIAGNSCGSRRGSKAKNAKRCDEYQVAHRSSLGGIHRLFIRDHVIEKLDCD